MHFLKNSHVFSYAKLGKLFFLKEKRWENNSLLGTIFSSIGHSKNIWICSFFKIAVRWIEERARYGFVYTNPKNLVFDLWGQSPKTPVSMLRPTLHFITCQLQQPVCVATLDDSKKIISDIYNGLINPPYL